MCKVHTSLLYTRVVHKKFSYENCDFWVSYFIWKHHMKTWNFLWISDLISRLKYEIVSPWDYIQFLLAIILSLNVHGDSGITWNMGLMQVWSHISDTLIKLVEPRILEFRLEWIQYPHRRRCNGCGCGHDETRSAYPLWARGMPRPYPPPDGCRCVLRKVIPHGHCRGGSLQQGRWGESRRWFGIWLNVAPAALVIPPLLTALFRSNPSKADVLSPTPYRPITIEVTEQGGRARASHYFWVQNPLVISPWLADPVLEGGSHGKQALQNAISVKWQPPQQQGTKCCCGADRRAGVSTLCG